MRVFTITCPKALMERLPAALPEAEIVTLPAEARTTAAHDGEMTPDDLVVAMEVRRPEGTLPPVKLLQLPGAGADRIDMASIAPQTPICNVYEHEIPIAEFVLLAMLEWEINLAAMRANFTPDSWPALSRQRDLHGELFRKTVAIVGFGRIGTETARRAQAFGMHVIAVARREVDGPIDEVQHIDNLADVLPRCDYVINTLPLNDQTRGLFGPAAFAAMKPSAVIVNVGRGGTIDEDALYAALTDKTIGGAVIDVWWRYARGDEISLAPSKYDFLSLPNVIATPHASAISPALWDRRAATIAKNLRSAAKGEPLVNVLRAAGS